MIYRIDTHCPLCLCDGLMLDIAMEHDGATDGGWSPVRTFVRAQPCGHDDACDTLAGDDERIADWIADGEYAAVYDSCAVCLSGINRTDYPLCVRCEGAARGAAHTSYPAERGVRRHLTTTEG